jgi:hypothetical protein
MTEVIFADDLPYWKTSTQAANHWIEKAGIEIERAGGEVIGDACGKLPGGGTALILQFRLGGDVFRILWPVVTPRSERDLPVARRQAATALFHDVKARCMSVRFLGARSAFCGFLLLPDGRTVGEIATRQPLELPEILSLHKALVSGEET